MFNLKLDSVGCLSHPCWGHVSVIHDGPNHIVFVLDLSSEVSLIYTLTISKSKAPNYCFCPSFVKWV